MPVWSKACLPSAARRRLPRLPIVLLSALGLVGGLWAGQVEPETALRKELGPLTAQQVILGEFWNHTPEYYQARIDTLSEKLPAGKLPHEQFAAVDQLAVAYLQLEQYDRALTIIDRKQEVDPDDYNLHANKSIILARRAAAAGAADTSAADWTGAEAEARAALVKSADPLKRDALYLRLLTWLSQVRADPTLRGRQSLLGYDIQTQFAAAIERDRKAGVEHPALLSNAELAKVLGEDPGFIDALCALVAIDSLAVPDGLLALSDLAAVQGDLETAYDGYCRLGELGKYPGELLEARRQRLLAQAQATVQVGPDRNISMTLDDAGRRALDEQCYQRYLAGRRAAQAYTRAYDAFEREHLKPGTALPTQRKLLEAFQKQLEGSHEADPVDVPADWDTINHPADEGEADWPTFFGQLALWVPLALVCVTVLFAAVRLLRRYDRSTVGS